jgi:hypothetical protein
LFAALWLSLIIWTYRDIRRRTRFDPLARILAVLWWLCCSCRVSWYILFSALRGPSKKIFNKHSKKKPSSIHRDNVVCPGMWAARA